MRSELQRERVLLTCPEQVSVLAAVRGLRLVGYDPWVAGQSRGSFAAVSRATSGFVQVPRAARDPGGFARAVFAAASDIGATVVVPGTERALLALSCFSYARQTSVRLGAPTRAALDLMTSKEALGVLAACGGFSVPAAMVVDRDAISGWLGEFPVAVKSLRSELDRSGGFAHGSTQIARSRAEAEQAAFSMPGDRVILQSFIEGPLVSVAGVAWKGELHAPTEFTATRTWPISGGALAWGETVALDQTIADGIQAIIRKCGFEGLLQVQFIQGAERLYVIDINPRLYASVGLAIAAGHNLPAIWVDFLAGRQPSIGTSYRTGVRFRAEHNDFRIAATEAAGRQWRKATTTLRPRTGAVHAIWSIRDPAPCISVAVRAGQALAALRGDARGRARRFTSRGQPGLWELGAFDSGSLN